MEALQDGCEVGGGDGGDAVEPRAAQACSTTLRAPLSLSSHLNLEIERVKLRESIYGRAALYGRVGIFTVNHPWWQWLS